MAKSKSVDVKSAVAIAMDYLKGFEDVVGPIREIRLEETEYDDSGCWLITLSTVEGGGIAALTGKRNYKQFRIDAGTGKVRSMNVRTLQPVE
jgi:hypothetical protein